MRDAKEKTLFISPKVDKENKILIPIDNVDNIEYAHPNDFSDIRLNDKRLSDNKKLSDYRFIFFELPAIIGCDLAVEIIKNANKFMQQFKDQKIEIEIEDEVIKRYFDKVEKN